jgi:hypothetical protein
MKLHSKFALLDVGHGRKGLVKALKIGKNGYPVNGERIPVTITGYITHQWGGDDGESIEFGVEVESVEAGAVERD